MFDLRSHIRAAQGLGLPLVPPYLGGGSGEDFRKGVNFAVAGATALDLSFFRAKGIQATWTDRSLHVQIGLFKQLLPSIFPGHGMPMLMVEYNYLVIYM